MNKKILAMLLTITILIGLVPASVAHAIAPTIVFTVTPDVTEADPGDTVTYTISLKTSENVSGTQFYLNIPTGMTYVAGSGKIDPNLKETLNNEYNHIGEVSFTEKLKMYIANTGALEGLNNLSGGVTFGTFQCTVDADASGNIEVGLTIDVLDDGDVNPYPESRYTVQTTPVKITAAPKPATGISLNKSTTTIYTGSEETLTATVTPTDTTDTVTWTSGNTAVVTVDDTGKVTAVAVGTATITAQAGSQSATCVVTVTNAPCTHTNKSTVSAKDSTCTVKGWDEYKKCDDCGQLFNTSDVEIDEIPFLNLADHSYTAEKKKAEALKTAGNCRDKAVYYYSCAVCGNVEHDDAHTFLPDSRLHREVRFCNTYTGSYRSRYYDCAYCDQIGTTTWDSTTYGEHNYAAVWSSDESGHWHECSLCHDKKDEAAHTPGAAATETTPQKCTECDYIITPALGHTHSLTKVDAKAPTCTEDGNIEYYTCSGCSKWYKDTTGSVEITDHSSVVIGHLGHDWADATCTAPKTCSRCDATEGTALGHAWKDATCTAPKTCNTCGATEGDPLGHSEGTEWKYDSENHWHTCTVAGCGVVIDSSKAAHTPDRAAATETDPVKCSVCGYVITPASGHTHDVDTTKYESDETNHWNTCSGCSEKLNISAHDFEWKIDKDATATEKGSKHEECMVCGYARPAVEIPTTGSTPEPGDNSNMFLWIALLSVSGVGVVTIIVYVYVKKRKSVK